MKKLFILTLCFLGCLFFATQIVYSQNTANANVQSFNENKLTKEVTVKQVKRMSNGELIELLPAKTKKEVNKLLAIKQVNHKNVYAFVKKGIIIYIKNK